MFTGLLLWIAIGNLELKTVTKTWDSANKMLIILSAVIALLSHYFRAERWKLLLNPIGYPLKSNHSFMSVMVGYFVNLVIPRGGEVSRCYNLYKLNKTPVDISFGTVISERLIDLSFLLTLIGTVFLIQLETLSDFFSSIDWTQQSAQASNSIGIYAGIAAALISAFIILIFYMKQKGMLDSLLLKAKAFITGIKSGALSIFKLEKRFLFILYSLLIWTSYYLMNYFVLQAFDATSSLDLSAALTIFVIGGIALAIPLPGGAGSYHLLISTGLTFIYGVADDQALGFSVIVHAWQTLVIIVFGAGSLIVSQLYYKAQKT
jgi:uncharacterized protein (TIRG00374 family)